MNAKELLVAWRNDAYSMERSLAKVLENHAKDAKDHPEVRARDEQHLAETRDHAEKVARCLDLLGEKPSTTKGMIGSMMGVVQGAASGAAKDEIMKNFLMDHAAEHMEIGCYEALIAGSDELGYPEIARICSEILAEEQAMAEWLEERIPQVARQSLQQLATR